MPPFASMNPAAQVVHVVPALFGADERSFGGAERYALELARHMAETTPTRLVTFGPRDRVENFAALAVRVIGDPHYVRGQRANPFAWAMLSELRAADVVHCHQQHIVASTVAALLGRLTGRRVFVTDLGGGGWDLSSYLSTDRLYRGHLHLSEYSKRCFGHCGKPWAYVVGGGVDTEKFSPDATVRREPTVVFVGRLLPHKGISILVDSMPQRLALQVIGRGCDSAYVERLRERAAGKPVCFLGRADDAALVRAYRSALCVVLPSVYRFEGGETRVPELLGQTLLEGMACGAPAICTNVASLPEIVEDGVTGFVVPPNDPAALGARIEWLRDHPEAARAMGAAGRRRVLENFTWPAVVRRCLEIYAGCV